MINEILDGGKEYEELDAKQVAYTPRQIEEKKAYPKKWIKDCWVSYHGGGTPTGFTSVWAFCQVLYDICEAKDVSPAVWVPTIPGSPRNMKAWVTGAKKWLARDDNQESFRQWLERITL